MLTIVTWLWKSTGDWRQGYKASHVNTLENMLKEHLHIPHRVVCVTDMPKGINCETIKLWKDSVKHSNPSKPHCYRRLRAFSEEAERWFGKRFVSMDLDCVIIGDVTPILDIKDDFKMLRGHVCTYNGSMWIMDVGVRKEVYEDFDPITSPELARSGVNLDGRPFYGSDQAWISYKLGDKEKMWDTEDGVYQFSHLDKRVLPSNAKMVFFAGGIKPWNESVFSQLQREYVKYV